MDDWPLAKILYQISGGKPGSVTVVRLFGGLDVTGPWYPPLEACMSQCRGCPALPGADRSSVADHRLGELSGGNWMVHFNRRPPLR